MADARVRVHIDTERLTHTIKAYIDERVQPLIALVRDLYDDGQCWHDHHGYCQEHGWTATDPACPHARAKALLADLDGPQTASDATDGLPWTPHPTPIADILEEARQPFTEEDVQRLIAVLQRDCDVCSGRLGCREHWSQARAALVALAEAGRLRPPPPEIAEVVHRHSESGAPPVDDAPEPHPDDEHVPVEFRGPRRPFWRIW